MNSNHKQKLNVSTQDLSYEYLVDVISDNGNVVDITNMIQNLNDLSFSVNKAKLTMHRPRLGWSFDLVVSIEGKDKDGGDIFIKGEEALTLLFEATIKNIFVFEYFTRDHVSPYYEMSEELESLGVVIDKDLVSYHKLKKIHNAMKG